MTTHECDVLVVGSGGARQRPALEAAHAGAEIHGAPEGKPRTWGNQ